MLVQLKSRLMEAEVQSLLAYAVYPDTEKLRQTLHHYLTEDDWELWGYEDEDEQHLIGLIGFVMNSDNTLEIIHIAVDPEYRGNSYGRLMVLELIEMCEPEAIQAETDDEAVDFYRHIGFTVVSLGERFPGTERYLCTYEV